MSDDATELVRLYNEGKSIGQIAGITGLTRQRVYLLVSPHVVMRTTARRMEARKMALLDAYERILAGSATPDGEADRLGYRHRTSLLEAFRSIGLKLGRATEEKHGTMHRYNRLKCRCPECRQAAKDEHAARVARGPKKHGTPSAYKNYGCRCPRCTRAYSRYQRQRKVKLRTKKGVTT